MEFELLNDKLKEIEAKKDKLFDMCKISDKKQELSLLEEQTTKEEFYLDNDNMKKVLSKIKVISDKIKKFVSLEKDIDDIKLFLEVAKSDDDTEGLKEAKRLLSVSEETLEKLEIESLLSDDYDSSNAIISIHPGAGGTESQDWADMLYRMYQRWAQRSEFDTQLLDYEVGEEAGIKSVSFLIKGINAYGYLKGESGVHRLVRISPFDSNKRRHTSFAAVEVMPEIDDDITVDIKPEDLEIDTFRSSGAGGQHVNKTESAIRIKHIPTGIIASCQTERSQMQNREYAMKMLKARIFELERKKMQEEKQKIKGESLDIAWGSQIRSYVFAPYTLVKDHRTGFEVGNVQAVMDGKLDEFMYAYLKLISKF